MYLTHTAINEPASSVGSEMGKPKRGSQGKAGGRWARNRGTTAGAGGVILVWSRAPERFKTLPGDIVAVDSDVSAICTAAARGHACQAVIADVVGPDGSERGYRLTHLLRTHLKMVCPIFLIAATCSASSRAYALQCGATRLLNDHHEIVEDLLSLLVPGSVQYRQAE